MRGVQNHGAARWPGSPRERAVTPTPDLHGSVLAAWFLVPAAGAQVQTASAPPAGGRETARPSPPRDRALLHAQHGGNSTTSHSVKGAGHQGHTVRDAIYVPCPEMAACQRPAGGCLGLWARGAAEGAPRASPGSEDALRPTDGRTTWSRYRKH